MMKTIQKAVTFLCLAIIAEFAGAQNPIITCGYSADPAPFVYGDSVYVYYDVDLGVVPSTGDSYYYMDEWRVASSADMVNWTDHGTALPLSAFSWSKAGTAWASQCVERNGKFYWYVCCEYPGHWHSIGVAMANSPTGPFRDMLRKPLIVTNEMGDIDPTVFIDDNGQAYLYWGNNKLRYVKLNSNMITYDKTIGNNGIVTVELTKEAFGGVKVDGKVQGENCFEEGPWLTKHNQLYYLLYAAGGVPENIGYSTSNAPTGPWKYRGKVMDVENTNSFTNHSGNVNFKGQDYFFYHTGWLNGGSGFKRSIAVEYLTFNDDGTIQQIKPTRKGVAPVATLSPLELQEAETFNNCRGITVNGNAAKGVNVEFHANNDSVAVRNADFGEDPVKSVTLRLASTRGGRIYVRLDKNVSTSIATIDVPNTGSLTQFEEVTVNLSREVTGKHRIIFIYSGSGNAVWDKWQFHTETSEALGIESVSADEASSSYFSIDGIAHQHPVKGLNIHRGKKFIMH